MDYKTFSGLQNLRHRELSRYHISKILKPPKKYVFSENNVMGGGICVFSSVDDLMGVVSYFCSNMVFIHPGIKDHTAETLYFPTRNQWKSVGAQYWTNSVKSKFCPEQDSQSFP